jgi:hypothetical protein
VVVVQPYQAETFCSSVGKYMMRLTLEDPTTRIHAFVFNKDGETIFDSYPNIANLKKKLNRLLGVTKCEVIVVTDTPRNLSWVSVCIKSYYTSKTNALASRIFALFDTKIVGERALIYPDVVM